MINNADLNAPTVPFPRERNYPPEYTEAIAAIEERHKQQLERLSQELSIGLQTEATARAEEQVQEQISSLQNLYKQQRKQNVQLTWVRWIKKQQEVEQASLLGVADQIWECITPTRKYL